MDAPLPPLLVTLLERLGGQEALEMEFKAAQGGPPQSIWPTMSAFGNTLGGWILLGVREGESGPIFEGIKNPKALMQDISNQLRNKNKISHPVCGIQDIFIDSTLGNELLVIRVPAARRKERPVYINGNPYGGTYLRREGGDYLCTKPEVDRMMREASDVAADSAILSTLGMDDIDRDTLASYRQRFQTRDPASHLNGYDDRRFLEALTAFRTDRETKKSGLTTAGLLLFGKQECLQEWRPSHLVDFRLLGSDQAAGKRWDDRLAWTGNLLGAFDSVYPRLIADLPTPFRLEGATRIDESAIHVALREALVNLLVHADYSESISSIVIRSRDGYHFRNPGNSRVSELDLLSGDRSDPRNPVLIRAFRRIGLAEEAGSGIPSIFRAWSDLGFQLPNIDVGTERYEFSLRLRYAHLLSEEDRVWLITLGQGWTEREQLALVCARHEGQVDNLTLRRLTGLHPADATKVLGSLRDRGLLLMVSSGRGAHYVLGPGAQAALLRTGTHAVQLPLGEVGHDSKDRATSSEDTRTNIESRASNSEDNESHLITDWEELLRIAQPARSSKRLSHAKRSAILIELCAQSPLSIRDLAEIMGRSEALILEAVRSLVASGELAFLYPKRPQHPRQKYVSTRRPTIA